LRCFEAIAGVHTCSFVEQQYANQELESRIDNSSEVYVEKIAHVVPLLQIKQDCKSLMNNEPRTTVIGKYDVDDNRWRRNLASRHLKLLQRQHERRRFIMPSDWDGEVPDISIGFAR
jgi:hypothetical protein